MTGASPAGRARLVLATANAKKLAELARILQAGGVAADLAGLGEFPGAPDVRETGATFAANALLKARAIAAFTGLPAVADDSGLCVDALNGMPGVLSARWAGRHGDDEANLRLVLGQLADVPQERRGAQFACSAALVLPSGREYVSEGIMAGRIIHEARGGNGFGYDPIFVADEAQDGTQAQDGTGELTNGELSADAKDRISHRGRALRALAPVIADWLSG
ncbi:MAG TPA: RdgB/HAM1 family non-canonical purine NTP pyrophosphatase [Streptosporangiaceae bacterium]|nr:RdgB/HAM1 family non-canonical purine NTP pyrophosphatase [Streptosporangiaceae bacterium]